MNSPEVARPFLRETPVSETAHRAWFARISEDSGQYLFAIIASELGHIGNLGFKNIDRRHMRAELWIYVGERSATGRGLGTSAIRQALRVGFEQMALAKTYLHVEPSNRAALRVYSKAGFQSEGTLREEVDFEGARCDLVRMSILDRDWRSLNGIGPRVVLMQPQFLPWLGYLELTARADLFIFLDDFQFSRQSWSHRNRLFVARGKVGMVTLPIRHEHDLDATFLDIHEADTAWRRKFRNLVDCNYRKAPYGEAVAALLRDWLVADYANVAELEIGLAERIAGYLTLRPRFLRSSQFDTRGMTRSKRVTALLAAVGAGTYLSPRGSFDYMKDEGVFPIEGIPVYFQNHVSQPYPQHGCTDFVANLGSLDALANLHPVVVRQIIRGTRWWQSWEERAVESAPLQSEGVDLCQH
jgi:RimJ/RimL family protein N-acetyltransferase